MDNDLKEFDRGVRQAQREIERKRGGPHRIGRVACPECGRAFDLSDSHDAAEWAYGHDCEV